MTREGLARRISKMAFGRANDAVRLLFLEDESLETVEDMELGMVSEIKRNANGTVEVKLINRIELLALLARLVEDGKPDGGQPGLESFFKALDRAAARRSGDDGEI